MGVFVGGCDIGMFKAGDQLCFSFKTADEIGMVGEAWDDDFDGNFAPDSRLKCAVDCAETARAMLPASITPPCDELLCSL